ncbi:MAG TPA: dienelactone hydrolase family protein [Acidisarcina sp.]
MSIRTEVVRYRDGDQDLTGTLFLGATTTEKSPGILVVHGGAGLDEHARQQALRFAELGYVVFACDIYGDGVAGDRQRVMARIAELRQDIARLRQRASAGLKILRSHQQVDDRLAVVGYCFGGMTALELARSGEKVVGVVSVHGTLGTSHPAEEGTIKAKILVCHGALDPHVPMSQVSDFVIEMNTARADFQLVVYGGAMHGFTHKTGPHPPGVSYDAVTDARSFNAMGAFLEELFL